MEKKLITKEQCYVQDKCKKYLQNTCEDLFCIRLYKIDELYNQSLLSFDQRHLLKLRLDENRIDEAAYKLLQEYTKNIIDFISAGKNLYIYSSNTGNGKTSWAIKFIQAYIQKIWASSDLVCRALFISVPRFTRELKLNITSHSDYIQHINDNVLSADLVIWDDIAIKTTTEFEHEQLISIIDSRLESNKSNIFTSNIPPHDLTNYLGARLTSRIIGSSTIIAFQGADKRGWNK